MVRLVLATEAWPTSCAPSWRRCQTHAMAWPDEREATNWLLAQVNRDGKSLATRAQAQVWLQAAVGGPANALDWARSGAQRRDLVRAAAGAGARRLVAAGAVAGSAPTGRVAKAVSRPDGPGQRRRAALLPRRAVAARTALGCARPWSKALLEAARSVEHPFNPGLMQEAWAARTRRVLARLPNAP